MMKHEKSKTDLTAVLPNGELFDFWERECGYDRELHVDGQDPEASDDNEADGNLYLCMKGGYLRVMYPEPETCLDLKTWQEFYGFDRNGESFWFGFDLDRETMQIRLKKRTDAPVHAPGPARPVTVPRDPEQVRKVQGITEVPCDFKGNARGPETLPGPFLSWDEAVRLFSSSF